MVLTTTKNNATKNTYAHRGLMHMVKMDIYISNERRVFGGFTVPYEKAKYIILGVPFEHSLTYKTGTSIAPFRVREASEAIESFSLRAKYDFDKCPVADVGDVVVVPGDVHQTLSRISNVVENLVNDGKIPVLIGGEHTITYGVIRALRKHSPCVIVFDAHFDLRDKYLGYKFSHASIMRRICETLGTRKMMFIGVRGFSEEEYVYVRQRNIAYVTSVQLLNESKAALKIIRSFLNNCRKTYVTIDMDVFDPSYAPGVDNPEPEGITPTIFFDILFNIIDNRTIGLDVVESSPLVDVNDVTSVLAAKVIKEAIIYHYVKTFK